MKLFYSQGACSLSPHIVLHELGFKHELVAVDLKKGTYEGGDYKKVNPKGYVPALQLENGEILTEGPAIIQYLADLRPELKLAPPAGTFERYRLMEWLNFITSEFHKGFGPIFHDQPKQVQDDARKNLKERFSYVNQRLEGKKFLMGDQFTVADAYLYVMLSWCGKAGVEISAFGQLQDYFKRVGERPAVKASLRMEADRAAKAA